MSIIGARNGEDATARPGIVPRQRDIDRSAAIRALCGGDPVVYACRLPDGVIKIGWTSDLSRRRSNIGQGVEVLAFVPGDRPAEQAIHARLRDHRHHGIEYYHPTAEVLAVVNEMRDRFNLPHITR